MSGGLDGVQSVTGAAAGVVDNTDPINPIIAVQFGEDTTISKANSAAALKTILEFLTRYESNTAGAEHTVTLLKHLVAGVQVESARIGSYLGTPGIAIPSGNILGLTTHAANFTGFFHTTSGGEQIRIFVNGTLVAQWLSTGTINIKGTGTPGFVGIANFDLGDGASTNAVRCFNRILETKGTSSLSSGTLTLGSGNYFQDPGGDVKGIVAANWLEGSKIQLQLATGRTLTHNSGTPGAGAFPLLLRGGANYVSTADVAANGYAIKEFIKDDTLGWLDIGGTP